MTFEDQIESIVTGFLISKETNGRGGRCELSLKDFSGAEPILEDCPDELSLLIPVDLMPSDVPFVNVKTVGKANIDKDTVIFHRLRRLPSKDFRGKTLKMMRAMLEFSAGEITPEGIMHSGKNYIGSNEGTIWNYLGPSNYFEKPEAMDTDDSFKVKMHLGLAYLKPYYWHVGIQFEDTPEISLSTDATGSKEIFRLRDIPNGKQRRAALLNWISQHWRKKRKDSPSADIKVREHLRGADSFNWNGMRCSITPSTFDQMKLESLKIGVKPIIPVCICGKPCDAAAIAKRELPDVIKKPLIEKLNTAMQESLSVLGKLKKYRGDSKFKDIKKTMANGVARSFRTCSGAVIPLSKHKNHTCTAHYKLEIVIPIINDFFIKIEKNMGNNYFERIKSKDITLLFDATTREWERLASSQIDSFTDL